MPKDLPTTICPCKDETVRLPRYFKLTENGRFKCYRGKCPNGCGRRLEATERVPEGHTKWNPPVCKRTDRDRPQFIPNDLHIKLQEEKRLREEREKNGQGEVDSESTEVDAE